MIKLVLCLVAATVYLNPLYPVYALEGSNPSSIKPVGPTTAIKRMEENREKLSSKEAELRLKMEDKVATRVGELREKIASRAAMLRQKLAAFKDKTKALRAEKVNESLQTINANRTRMMTTQLEVLTKILNTIEDRVNEAAATGKNVDLAKSAISSARSAIEKATAAIGAQSDKDYTLEISTEVTVKTEAKSTRDTLLSDLKATHQIVKEAREAVTAALKAAKEALGVGATPSASI